MKCTPMIELMHRYFDNDISAEKEKELIYHLDTCETCRVHFQEIKETESFLKSVNKISAPNDFTANVMNQLPREKKFTRIKYWFKTHPLIVATTVFVLLMTGSIFSVWNDNGQLSVTKQPNLVIKESTVLVPKGEVVKGDVIVRNGDLKIDGEVQGDVVVINGDKYLASAGRVTGQMKEIDAVFDWIWYNIKSIFSEVVPNQKGD